MTHPVLKTSAVLIAAACLLAACDKGDPARQASQYGNGPDLPAAKNYLPGGELMENLTAPSDFSPKKK